MKKITQEDRVVQYISDFGSITSLEAFKDLGITRLSAKIFNLKAEGYIFEDETCACVNRYGDKVHYKKYKIIDKR